MISTNDLKTGITVELDNGIWSVVEFCMLNLARELLL